MSSLWYRSQQDFSTCTRYIICWRTPNLHFVTYTSSAFRIASAQLIWVCCPHSSLIMGHHYPWSLTLKTISVSAPLPWTCLNDWHDLNQLLWNLDSFIVNDKISCQWPHDCDTLSVAHADISRSNFQHGYLHHPNLQPLYHIERTY